MKKRTLFVCLGNICRSPLAHYVLQNKIVQQGLKQEWEVDSCGLGNWHIGQLSDNRMIQTARKHGINLKHRARQFNPNEVKDFDHIFVMDRDNYNGIIKLLTKEFHNKIKLFRIYENTDSQKTLEVPDPYYQGINGFEEVFKIVDKNCELILNKLR